MAQAHKLSTITEDFLLDEVRRYMRRHTSDPLLCWYSIDGTPLKTRQRWTMDREHMVVRRSGRSNKDYAVQRIFVKAQGDRACSFFIAPRILEDKSSWSSLQCFRDMTPLPSSNGHEGLVLIIVMADRALLSSIARQVWQFLECETLVLESNSGSEHALARASQRLFVFRMLWSRLPWFFQTFLGELFRGQDLDEAHIHSHGISEECLRHPSQECLGLVALGCRVA